MGNFPLNHHDLSQYSLIRKQVLELDENISEIEEELKELNKYNIDISPVYSGMPSGNEKRDKIAEFVIRLESDRNKLENEIATLKAERAVLAYSLHKIRTVVNRVADEQLRQIIKWHYLDGDSIDEIADKASMTMDGVYKKLNRFFESRIKKRKSLPKGNG
jgi:SMC interacting uncharacterized protein involved in chromosome segregation